jgi:hypothetical protein
MPETKERGRMAWVNRNAWVSEVINNKVSPALQVLEMKVTIQIIRTTQMIEISSINYQPNAYSTKLLFHRWEESHQ